MREISGADMDIDVNHTRWNPEGECPWRKGKKCAVKKVSLCKYFRGVKHPDVLLCGYKK
jgi:hypothetical protein